ncbi:MAG: hypothetical protein JNN15_00870 [Blastocatellia bacterium]|nr:hypothetical protein [Blastocatellia bacterium]
MTKSLRHLFLFILLFSLAIINVESAGVSTVTFEFDGMMGLFMGNPNKISVGVLDAHHHSPEITFYKLVGNEKREIARFTAAQLKKTINIGMEGTKSRRLGRYLSLSGRENDAQDFTWTVDVENDLYGGRKLKIKEDGFLTKIHFSTGIFYSTKLSEEKYRFIAADGSGKAVSFLRKVGQPGARVNLEKGQSLLISGVDTPLRLTAEDGVSYLVTVYNLPPPEMANLNHFLMYYDIIDEFLPKYEPVVAKKSFAGTGDSLCAPKVFGNSGLN